MKKILLIFLSFLSVITLVGCDVPRYPSETNMEYMAAALGFDAKYGSVTAFAEIVVVNSDSKAENTSKNLLSAEGKTVETALYNLRASLSKPLMLNHCGLLVLSQRLNNTQLTEIWDYCFNDKSITQSIEVVCTDSTEKLLSLKPSSAVAMGYELSTTLKQNSEYTGIKYRNRYYQIENLRKRKVNCYAVPFLSVEDSKHKIEGLQVYFDDAAVLRIEEESAPLYSMVNNSYNMGVITLNDKCFNADLDSVDYKFSYGDKTLSVELTLKLDGDKNAVSAISKSIDEQVISNKDIYGIADEIYRRDLTLWNKIKNDYNKIFAAAEIKLKVRREGNG